MARLLTAKDAHAVMNLLVKQATGQQTVTATDTSSFVAAGETVLATGMENVLNSLSIVIGRSILAVKPYQAKLSLINALNTGIYTSRLRKISYYADEAQAAGDWNTDLYTNLKDGYDNGTNGGQSTASMWEQKQKPVLEMNFAGQNVYDYEVTVYQNQLAKAFADESSFNAFVNGIMVEANNDMESMKEAFNRMAILNKIGSVYDMSSVMPGSVINLTTAFNAKFNTNYTKEDLMSTYLKDFLEFFIAEFKKVSDRMTYRSAKYHWSPAKTVGDKSYKLLRHTPKADQRAILYNPLFIDAQAKVLPEIFNDKYLQTPNAEMVDFWQGESDPMAVKVTPAVTDTTTGLQKAGDAVDLTVVGMLFDKDAILTDFQFESAETTPLEARKRYRNIFWHYSKNIIADPTENCVIFVM